MPTVIPCLCRADTFEAGGSATCRPEDVHNNTAPSRIAAASVVGHVLTSASGSIQATRSDILPWHNWAKDDKDDGKGWFS